MQDLSNTQIQAAVRYRLDGAENTMSGTSGLLVINQNQIQLLRNELGQDVTVLTKSVDDVQKVEVSGSLELDMRIEFKDSQVIFVSFTGEKEMFQLSDLIFGMFVRATPGSSAPEAAGRAANRFKRYFRNRNLLAPASAKKRILTSVLAIAVVTFIVFVVIVPLVKG